VELQEERKSVLTSVLIDSKLEEKEKDQTDKG